MPIYEYVCKECCHRFEEFQRIGGDNEDLVCPKCGTPKPDRILSAFSASGSTGAVASTGSCGPSGSPFS